MGKREKAGKGSIGGEEKGVRNIDMRLRERKPKKQHSWRREV